MSPAQRELLVETLADLAKGLLLGGGLLVFIDRATLGGLLALLALAAGCYGLAHWLTARKGCV